MTGIRRLAERLHAFVLAELKDEILDALDYESIATGVLDRVGDFGYLSDKARRIAKEMEEEIIDKLVNLVQREVVFPDEVKFDQRDYDEIAERVIEHIIGGWL